MIYHDVPKSSAWTYWLPTFSNTRFSHCFCCMDSVFPATSGTSLALLLVLQQTSSSLSPYMKQCRHYRVKEEEQREQWKNHDRVNGNVTETGGSRFWFWNHNDHQNGTDYYRDPLAINLFDPSAASLRSGESWMYPEIPPVPLMGNACVSRIFVDSVGIYGLFVMLKVIVDSQHLVENWGDGAASWWYYVPRWDIGNGERVKCQGWCETFL